MPSSLESRYKQGTNAQRLAISPRRLPLGTIWFETDTGLFYDVVFNGSVHVYAPFGSGVTSAFAGLLYIVDDNPVLGPFVAPAPGVRGPFDSIANALAQIALDGPSGATILIQRGTYTEDITLPANISLAGGPQQGFESSCGIIGTITILGAGGTNTISGLALSSTSNVIVFGGVGNTKVEISNCQLSRSTAGIAVLATNTNVSSSLSFDNCIVNASATTETALDTQALSGELSLSNTIVSGAQIGLSSTYRDCDITGNIRSDSSISLLHSRLLSNTTDIRGIGATLSHLTIQGTNAAAAIVLLGAGTTTTTIATYINNTSGLQPSVSGTGSLSPLDGTLGGITRIAATVTIVNRTNGRGLAVPASGMSANGFYTPAGNDSITLLAETDALIVDCTGTAALSSITITLPEATTNMQFKEVIVKRIDNNPDVTINVVCAGTNEFDRTTPAVTSLPLGASDSYRLLASRAGRWLRIP